MSTIESRPRVTAERSSPAEVASRSDGPRGERLIDLGTIRDLQILDERGNVDESLKPNLSKDELLRIYRAMVLTRKFDIRMLNMQRQGQMGTFAPGFGQEATQIGQVYPLVAKDWYSPSYRSFGAQLWRGWTIDGLMLLWAGYFEGFEIPEGVNDLPFSIVIGSHVPLATGIAMAIRNCGDDAVVAVNFGDGAASQGVVSESFNFAAVHKAPIVFHVENNQYAISMRSENQAATPDIARRGVGFGIPSMRVDGNDILACIVASQDAVAHARAGDGPFLIEEVTYRMGVHTTADDPKVYRDDAEVEQWKKKDPIARFETYLKNKDIIDDGTIERINEECDQEVVAGRDKFRERASANPREIFDYVYEKLPPELEEQKAEYLKKLDRRGVD